MPKYVVRHGVMRLQGVFNTRARDRYSRGQRVITRTNRGLESGEVLCEASEHVLAQMEDPSTGQILRLVSASDETELQKLHEQRDQELLVCRQRIAELGLAMELVDVEHLYGGERVVVYYLAETRVDFRELVKQLAKEFQTRIEMRQIGVRDEAKLLADYGDCGKPVCCNTHLSEMPPVSMKMAKLQKATLDPTKISGRCGRLKCCLRYEYDTYRDLQKDLPRVGAEIITSNGKGKVLAQEVLTGQLLVQMEDMRRVSIDATTVLSVVAAKDAKPADAKPTDAKSADAKPAPANQPKPATENKQNPQQDQPNRSQQSQPPVEEPPNEPQSE